MAAMSMTRTQILIMAMVISLAKVIVMVWFLPAVNGDSHMWRSSLHVQQEDNGDKK